MSFCAQCGRGLQGGEQTCPACGAELRPSPERLRDSALDFVLIVAACLFLGGTAVAMIAVASSGGKGEVIRTIMIVGIGLTRLGVVFAVASFAKTLGRSPGQAWRLAAVAALPLADLLVAGSLLREAWPRVGGLRALRAL